MIGNRGEPFGEPKKGTARTRRILTLLSFVVAALLVWPLAWFGYRDSVAKAEASSVDDAEWVITTTLLSNQFEEFDPPANVWLVNVDEGWFDPVGEDWLEPPILKLAEDVLNGEEVVRYTFAGDWLSVGQWVGPDSVILTVVDRDGEVEAIRNARLKWLAIALLLPLGATLLAWKGLGLLRGPEQAARAVNREFIADAAHELRTPLSIIQASAGHALSRERDSDAYRESLEEILTATERAGASVGELLEFARLESGQASPRLAPLRLDLLVEEVAASIRVDGVEVEADPGEPVIIEADYNLIRQVIDNITRNATARATLVELSTHLEPGGVRIEISDNGPGFSEGVIDHVFERFRRGDQSGGVGLGMAVANRIVELHGGTCEAANQPAVSTPEGDQPAGALVSVHLPIAD